MNCTASASLTAIRVFALMLLLSFGVHSEQTRTFWQIGEFDKSSAEFATHLSAAEYADPSKDPVFVVGRSDPHSNWLPFQPGTSNGRAGFRRHPFSIRFQLTDVLAGNYKLDIALLAYSPRLPWIELSLNGHTGWFYQHPKLAYSGGDQAVFYLPYYSTAHLECYLPSHYLKRGENEIILTALDEPRTRDDSQASGFPWPGASGIVYDALALRHSTGPRPASAATVEPTVYYKQSGGRVSELVDVFLTNTSHAARSNVTLKLGSNRFTMPLDSARDFGQQRLEFEVPETDWNDDGEVQTENGAQNHQFPFHAQRARKWTILLCPNVHLDVGYSDYVSKVAEIHSRAVDEAMSMVRENPQFRFNLDGSWIVEQFLKGRTAEERHAFFQLVRDRKIFIPAVYASNFTGFSSIENLIRALYYTKKLSRERGVPFDFSLINDVPSYSWSLASVMAASGLRYFVAASDSYRAPFLLYNRFNETSPQWWEGPDGGRVLVWYSKHYHQMAGMFGLPPQIANGHDSLPRFLQEFDRPAYKSDAVLMFGTQVENTDLFPEQARLADEWNRVYAYPKLQYAGFPEAMARIAAQMGDSIPVVRGDGGPYWEDGMIANARLTAIAREEQHRILSAEKFSTISTLVDPRIRPDLDVIHRAWNNLLLVDEHSWQADRSVTDPESEQSIRQGAIKNSRGEEAARQVEFTLGRALAAIADRVDRPSGTLIAFNPLSWNRTGIIETDIDKGLAPFDAKDMRPVPFEILSSGRSYRHIRFVAEDVPPVGYKCFALRPALSDPPPATRPGPSQVLESPYYRVVLEPGTGAVQSIFDKELNKELEDRDSEFRFDQYLYVTGADELPNRLVQYSTVSPMPKLQLHPSGHGNIVSIGKTPFGSSALLESSSLNTPRIETEIRLFDRAKKIEFINRIQKKQVYAKEAAYFAFPLAMDNPEIRYETQNGFVNVRSDLLPGAGREWFNVQHWMAAEQAGLVAALVPVDAPMMTFGDIARGSWPAKFGNRKGTVFSYIMSNYTPEGYPAGQGGSFTFRYVLSTSNRFSASQNSRLGWEAMTPMELDEIRPNDKASFVHRALPSAADSFLGIDQKNVILLTWKLAEDGEGSIVRLLETEGRPVRVNLTFPGLNLVSAWRCNAVEDNSQPLDVGYDNLRVNLKPFEIVTIRVKIASS